MGWAHGGGGAQMGGVVEDLVFRAGVCKVGRVSGR